MADKFHGQIKAGSTSVSVPADLPEALTGLVAADITAYYWRQGGSATSITVVNLTAITDAYTSGGWKEVDATNLPGLYRFDLPNAALATGADWVVVAIIVAGALLEVLRFALESSGASELNTLVTAVKANTDNLPNAVKKNTPLNNFPFVARLASDHVTPAIGKTITAQRSIDGAAFAAAANSVVEIGSGGYRINMAASDLNGDVILWKFTEASIDTVFVVFLTEP